MTNAIKSLPGGSPFQSRTAGFGEKKRFRVRGGFYCPGRGETRNRKKGSKILGNPDGEDKIRGTGKKTAHHGKQ